MARRNFPGTIMKTLLWCCSLLRALSAICDIERKQYSALHSLFVSLNGQHWYWKSPNSGNIWNFSGSSDPCLNDWQGITCSNCNTTRTSGIILNQSSINALNLSMYHLKGPLPASALLNLVVQLGYTSIQVMDLSNNSLTGAIPTTIGAMTNLWNLHLEYNSLRGSLPTAVGSLSSNLVGFFVNNNKLTGTLPSQILELTSLKYLYVKYNSLSGSIPSLIGKLSQLQYLILRNNKMTGSFPSSITQLSNLLYIALVSNAFTGTIPADVGNLLSLNHLSFRLNQFSGTVPSSFANCKNLTQIRLDNNSFTGTLPSSLSTLSGMNIFTLSNNNFAGNIYSVFNTTLQRDLQFIDISSNQLTGSIPASLFNSPQLKVLSLTQNCFEGEIPSTICEATALQVLILDGLSSAQSCRVIIAPKFSGAYFTKVTVYGSIPQCLWGLTQLSTFQAAGNGIGGNLGNVVLAPSSPLTNVALSNNFITGAIPATLLQWPFAYLSLGNNKFGGTLNAMTNISAASRSGKDALILNINRLSGTLPQGLNSAYSDLNILSGNLFQCESSALPQNDPSAMSYICGSDELDNSIYLNLAVIGLIVLGFVGLLLRRIFLQSIVVSSHFQRGGKMTAPMTPAAGGADAMDISNARSFKAKAFSHVLSTESRRFAAVTGSGPIEKSTMIKDGKKCMSIFHTIGSFHDVMSDGLERQIASSLDFVFGCKLYHERVASFPNLHRFIGLLRQFRHISFTLGLLYAVLLFPVYTLLSYVHNSAYSTHVYEYGWKLTAAFFSGAPPAASLMLIWLFFAGHTLRRGQLMKRALRKLRVQRDTELRQMPLPSDTNLQPSPTGPLIQDDDLKSKSIHRLQVCFLQLIVAAMNLIVIIGINVIYTKTQISSTLSVVQKVVFQAIVACVKLTWNFVVLRFMVESLVAFNGDPEIKMVRYYLLLLACNNIIIPCLVTGVENSNCFSTIFAQSAPVPYSYFFSVCVDMPVLQPDGSYLPGCEGGIYADTSHVNSEFTPPFSYSFQCGDAIITTYVPLYTYTYSMLILAGPIFNILLTVIDESKIPAVLRCNMSAIFWPRADPTRFKKVFDPDIEVVMLIQHMLIQLTFGAMSTELAFAICFSAILSTIVTQVLLIRYVCVRSEMLESICQPGGAVALERSESLESRLNPLVEVEIDDLTATKDCSVEGAVRKVEAEAAAESKTGRQENVDVKAVATSTFTGCEISRAFPEEELYDRKGTAEDDHLQINIMGSKDSQHEVNEAMMAIDKCSKELLLPVERCFSGSWLRLLNGMDIAFAVACLFYAGIIFDIAADGDGWRTALMVVLPCLTAPLLMIAHRFISKYKVIQRLHESANRYWNNNLRGAAEAGEQPPRKECNEEERKVADDADANFATVNYVRDEASGVGILHQIVQL